VPLLGRNPVPVTILALESPDPNEHALEFVDTNDHAAEVSKLGFLGP
jgi:hypothetical protein